MSLAICLLCLLKCTCENSQTRPRIPRAERGSAASAGRHPHSTSRRSDRRRPSSCVRTVAHVGELLSPIPLSQFPHHDRLRTPARNGTEVVRLPVFLFRWSAPNPQQCRCWLRRSLPRLSGRRIRAWCTSLRQACPELLPPPFSIPDDLTRCPDRSPTTAASSPHSIPPPASECPIATAAAKPVRSFLTSG